MESMRLSALELVVVAACSTTSPSNDGRSAGDDPTSEFKLRCDARKGRITTVTGEAEDAKSGAMLQDGTSITYVKDLAYWPAAELGKRHSLRGCLGTRQLPVAEELPGGIITQGVAGDGIAAELEREP